MLLKAFFFGISRQIIGKIHVDDVLLQISAVCQIKKIGVAFLVLGCIGFCKLALADTGNTMQKHLSVLFQQVVELFQFLCAPAEPTAGLGNIVGKYIVPNDRGKQSSIPILPK